MPGGLLCIVIWLWIIDGEDVKFVIILFFGDSPMAGAFFEDHILGSNYLIGIAII